MGVVLAAQHIQLDQPVAIKILLPSASENPKAVRRFLAEARAAARIRSEHVVRVSDVGTLDSGDPFMVMELLQGMDLAKVLHREGRLSLDCAVEYLLQACEGIAEAHRLQIVHRDLKPSNLFLTHRSDGSALIKVLDFGISKTIGHNLGASSALTDGASLMGSPTYMSPEQIRSPRDVDARADIWSLGIVLHELLTGAPVFVSHSPSALLAMIAADPPVPIRRLRPEIPEEIEATILRCLEKHPARRWADVGELSLAIAPFMSSPGPTSPNRAAKILRGLPTDPTPTAATQLSPEAPLPLSRTASPNIVLASPSRPSRMRLFLVIFGIAGAVLTGTGFLARRDPRLPSESSIPGSTQGSGPAQFARRSGESSNRVDESPASSLASHGESSELTVPSLLGSESAGAIALDASLPSTTAMNLPRIVHPTVRASASDESLTTAKAAAPTIHSSRRQRTVDLAGPVSSAQPASTRSVFDHRTF